MTFDGRTGMSLTWNDLGLVEKVSLNDTVLVNYSYLADGTKVSALDSEGDGLLHLGSLIYRKQGESISLESAGFAGGRFVAKETADGNVMVPMFHVTDHLGSVRAVVDGVSGEVVETNDYYPFGSRWNTATNLTDQTNRFRYNSKEEQSSLYPESVRNAVSYIDYGARQYDPVLGRWFAPDPLSDKYYGISPYAFCGNNPIRYEDVDGEDWVDKVVGYAIGIATNLIPGTGTMRDAYSPNSSSDYNSTLQTTDDAASALGTALVVGGTGGMAIGGTVAAAGVGVTVSTAGVGAIVGAPAVAVGAEVASVSAATTVTGGIMVMNSSKNKSDGYERGKSSKNSSSDYSFIQGTPGNKRKVTTQIPDGYKKVKGHHPHGADVFYNGKQYITPDKDNHNGGMWKMAKKLKDLFHRNTRMGTYDENLKRIGD